MELEGNTMRFQRCSIELPSENGLHIVSCAMGDGKTTMIAELCNAHAKKGILVVVQTINDADNLEQRLLAKKNPYYSYCKLHCENNTALTEYRTDPEKLSQYDILIITSARLLIDPPCLFTSYGSSERKYVLIDEMIHFYLKAFEITPDIIKALTFIDNQESHNEVRGKECKNNPGYYQHCYSDPELIKAAYSQYFPSNGSAKINDYRVDFISNHIASKGLTPLIRTIGDISQDSCCLLFDATADILFDSSRLLPISGKKYCSNIEFRSFSQTIRRKNSEIRRETVIKDAKSTITMIADLIKKGEKVLVVTWKTLDFYSSLVDENSCDVSTTHKSSSWFADELHSLIYKKTKGSGTFEVIYRGSGMDRASNEYREFSTVVFWGEWDIPNTTAIEIGRYFGTTCSLFDYKKSLIIQTIGRLRIRQHCGDPIKVFFSDDIDFRLMFEVQQYFIENSEAHCKIFGIPNPVLKHSKPNKKHLCDLVTLCMAHYDLWDAVSSETSYEKEISLDEIFNLIPKSRKEKGLYKNFLDFLRKEKNINIVIT